MRGSSSRARRRSPTGPTAACATCRCMALDQARERALRHRRRHVVGDRLGALPAAAPTATSTSCSCWRTAPTRRDEPERLAAALTTSLPVRFVTEARWIADTRRAPAARQPRALRPQRDRQGRLPLAGARARRARRRAAADRHRGQPPAAAQGRRRRARGRPADARAPRTSRWSRRTAATARSTGSTAGLGPVSHAQMAELLRERHVMLKLTRVEGMYGPPLEAFHMGATCVDDAGHRLRRVHRHGWNGVVVGWDDLHGTARALDCSPATARACTACATTRWRRRARGRRGSSPRAFMALALRAIAPRAAARAARRRDAADLGLRQRARRAASARCAAEHPRGDAHGARAEGVAVAVSGAMSACRAVRAAPLRAAAALGDQAVRRSGGSSAPTA